MKTVGKDIIREMRCVNDLFIAQIIFAFDTACPADGDGRSRPGDKCVLASGNHILKQL